MIRQLFNSKKKNNSNHIAWRGHEVTRIEAFSDAIFAFAVTLLIMSLEVPHDYEELMHGLMFIVPFGICFAIVMTIWYHQNLYFRKYGLHDMTTIVLNGIMMFSVLIFMFPLKFLIGALFMRKEFHFDNSQQVANVYCLYSGGFGLFYALFALMYLNAYRRRESLNLTEGEAFSTMTSVYVNLCITVVSFISTSIALANSKLMNGAGFVYAFIGPLIYIVTSRRDKKYKLFYGREQPALKTVPASKTATEMDAVPDDSLN